jgi:hypothetical protein
VNQELIDQIKALTIEDMILECAAKDLDEWIIERKLINGVWYERLGFMKQSLRAIRKRYGHDFQMQKLNDLRPISKVISANLIRALDGLTKTRKFKNWVKNAKMSSKSKRV